MMGLSEEAWDLLDPIFTLDYMGAAEFEFGAVPKTLSQFAESEMCAGALELESRAVYYLCHAEQQRDVEARIRDLANGKTRLKEHSYFRETLYDGTEDKYIGWLEINNGFLFFVEESAWRKTCALFGVDAH